MQINNTPAPAPCPPPLLSIRVFQTCDHSPLGQVGISSGKRVLQFFAIFLVRKWAKLHNKVETVLRRYYLKKVGTKLQIQGGRQSRPICGNRRRSDRQVAGRKPSGWLYINKLGLKEVEHTQQTVIHSTSLRLYL